MDNEFYNAFATAPAAPVIVAETVEIENETGTFQKPPKLMYIEDFKGWQNRFENWVQGNKFDALVLIEKEHVRPKDNLENEKPLSKFTPNEKLRYTSEKMMISLLQKAIKEDIFVLLQHEGTARSIWLALIQKFKGSADMIKNKRALLKKSFDMFTTFEDETTRKTIERYCHLVQEMKRLDIKKEDDEWVDKLADALPQNKWGTYLLILKHMRKSEDMNMCKFIQKLEEHDLDVQKTAIMKNPGAQQDTAFSADGTSGSNVSTKTQSGGYYSSYSSFDPNFSTPSSQQRSSTNLQCNGTLNIQNGQNFSPDIAKQHMASLVTVLESYESLVVGRIGNLMLTIEDYDQIDSEELELMDIKWCLASVLRRAEKFKQITGRDDLRDVATSQLGFDKSKVTCFHCREKGHLKWECTNREATGRQDPFGNNDYHRKAIYHQVAQLPHQQQSSHSRTIEESKGKTCHGWIDQEDERLPEGFSWDKYDPNRTWKKQHLLLESLKIQPQEKNQSNLRIVLEEYRSLTLQEVMRILMMRKSILIKLEKIWILTVLICFL
ncbi:putative transcription factor interactor and regulator CCHC(Zn) family [Helianthus annuus]|nr:putative transcription factor interactor and regulator CCHC(Zn) family [Helianthus annuus]